MLVCLRVVILLLLISALVNMVRSAFIPFGFRICEGVPWSKLHLEEEAKVCRRDRTRSKAGERRAGSRVRSFIRVLNLGSG